MLKRGRPRKSKNGKCVTVTASVDPEGIQYLKAIPGSGGSAGAGSRLLIRFAAAKKLKVS